MMDSVWAKFGAGIALASVAFGAAGCVSPQEREYLDASPAGKVALNTSRIIDHGNGIFEFPANDEFPQTLAKFRGERSDLKIIAVTQGPDHRSDNSTAAIGYAHSFVVVTEPARGQVGYKVP